jgi:hypothetical protein
MGKLVGGKGTNQSGIIRRFVITGHYNLITWTVLGRKGIFRVLNSFLETTDNRVIAACQYWFLSPYLQISVALRKIDEAWSHLLDIYDVLVEVPDCFASHVEIFGVLNL